VGAHFFRVESDFVVFKEERKVRLMLKVRLAVASLGMAMMLPATSVLFAQTANVAPAAPLPSQIFTAKKIFISYVVEEKIDPRLWDGGSAQPYNEFYAAIKSWGRYELVTAPGDADLIFEMNFADPVTGVSGSKESGCDSSSTPQFKLALTDPKTHITLWTLNESTSIGHLQKGRDKSLQEAIDKLVSDLKALTAQPIAASAAK
jgi:hypothetical protein